MASMHKTSKELRGTTDVSGLREELWACKKELAKEQMQVKELQFSLSRLNRLRADEKEGKYVGARGGITALQSIKEHLRGM